MAKIVDRLDPTTNYFYAVGDIQGEADLLNALIGKIENHPLIAMNDTVVFTGNFVGAGKGSQQVLDSLIQFKKDSKFKVVCVKGSDDHRFMRMKQSFLSSSVAKSIINSYRRPSESVYMRDKNRLEVKEMCKHRDWLFARHSFYITTKFLFCNAGINTDIPIGHHPTATLMFNSNKDQFLASNIKWPYFIVHGNYIETDDGLIKIKHNRINVNTNPNKTGKLSCAVINGTTLKVEDVITASR